MIALSIEVHRSLVNPIARMGDFVRLIFTVLFLMTGGCQMAAAQDAPTDSVQQPVWETDLTSRVSGAQTGYRNWQKGGVNTLAITVRIDGTTRRISKAWEQKHQTQLAIGLVRQDTLDFRKADDLINLLSSIRYKGDGFFRHFNPTVAVQTRTQFAPGYEYKRKTLNQNPPVKVSDFLSPVILTQTIGLTYDPATWFTHRLGIGGKETYVHITRFRPLYMGEDTTRSFQVELGIESQTTVNREIFENVRLESNLSVFAAVIKPSVPDLTWENNVIMKVNNWLSVNFTVDMLYDRDARAAVQLREVFALGFSFVII